MVSAGWLERNFLFPSAALALRLCVCALLVLTSACARGSHEAGAGDRSLVAAIAEVEAGRRTTPLISEADDGGDVKVTFLAKSIDGQVPRIVSDATGWGESPDDRFFDVRVGTMARVGSTEWYSLEARVVPGARIEYLVVQGPTDYQLDPYNPRRTTFSGGDVFSEFVTPGYEPPPEFVEPWTAPRGSVVEGRIESRALGGPLRVLVYTPPGYPEHGPYPVAVFLYGTQVVAGIAEPVTHLTTAENGEAPRVLDWLIVHRLIEPIVAVFLGSDLPGDPHSHAGAPMRAFLNHEVPEWMTSRYRVSARAEERAILAISRGAKDALDAAVDPDGVYGRLGLLVPGRRIRPADLDAIPSGGDRQMRVAILAGHYDAANIATARAARQVLEQAGHAVDFIEVPEGHTQTTWKNHLGKVLVSLFGPGQ